MATVHATCVVVEHAGLLLRGPSGSGKSDLALRLIHEAGGRLVADDRVLIQRGAGGTLWASAPVPLAGRIEVRGIGIIDVQHAGPARVDAVVDLVPHEEVVRLPEPESVSLMDVCLPRFALCAHDASATARLAVIARQCRRMGAGS